MRKQNRVSFEVPNVSLEKSPKTTVRRRGVRDGDRVSSVPEMSTPIVATHRIVRTIRPPWWSPTLKNILLTKGSEPLYKGEILRDGRLSKWS